MSSECIHLRITTYNRTGSKEIIDSLFINETLKKYIKKYLICYEVSEKGQPHMHCRIELTENYEINFKKRLSEFIKTQRLKNKIKGIPGYNTSIEEDKEKNESYTAKDGDIIKTNYSEEEINNIKEYIKEVKENMKKNTINKIIELYKKLPKEEQWKISTAGEVMKFIDNIYIKIWEKEPPNVGRLKCITLAIMKKLHIHDQQFLDSRYCY